MNLDFRFDYAHFSECSSTHSLSSSNSTPSNSFQVIRNISSVEKSSEDLKPILEKSFSSLHSSLSSSITQKKMPGGIHRVFGDGSISEQKSFIKMESNLSKSCVEHTAEFYKKLLKELGENFHQKDWPNPYVQFEELRHINPRIKNKSQTEFEEIFLSIFSKPILHLEHSFEEFQGPNKPMEDVHLYLKLPLGTIIGLLSGHNGKDVAKFVKKTFVISFQKILEHYSGNVHQTFEYMFSAIQEQLISYRAYNLIGSTAVFCYVEDSTDIAYVASLGPCEANIYRKIRGALKSIPMSCIRNWSTSRDEWRAMSATEGDYREGVAIYWNREKIPADQRKIEQKNIQGSLKNDQFGLNESRAFGFHAYNIGRRIQAIIHKPKITSCFIEPDDILILANRDFKKHVAEYLILECIEKNRHNSSNKISNELVDLAILKNSNDNISVATVKIN